MNCEAVLFALIRNVICGEELGEEVKTACTPEMLEDVYALAARHDLAHLVGQAVSKLGLPESEALGKCKNAAMQAFVRYMRLNHAYLQVCQILEAEGIPFIPLKGTVLRDCYPEPWMRTSCDTDILVHPEDLDRAAALLQEQLHYRHVEKTSHDVSLFSPDGMHLELHYATIEAYVSEPSEQILAGIWEDAVPAEGKRSQLCISDALFYYYHIAHMAKHLENGGCGIRPFLDIWVLTHRVEHDGKKREALLEKGGLLTFARAAEKLSQIWFSGDKPDALSLGLQQYIFDGGTYGSLHNMISRRRSKRGGKLGYALSRIFLPYDTIKFYYPILEKHKWLTPVYQPVRWCKLLFQGGVKRSAQELWANVSVSREEEASAEKLFEELGLSTDQ